MGVAQSPSVPPGRRQQFQLDYQLQRTLENEAAAFKKAAQQEAALKEAAQDADTAAAQRFPPPRVLVAPLQTVAEQGWWDYGARILWIYRICTAYFVVFLVKIHISHIAFSSGNLHSILQFP